MKLSSLQKYILKNSWQSKNAKVSRDVFERYYNDKKIIPSKKIRGNIITKSIERLIEKGLLIGFGEKTQHRLFINHVKLSPQGVKITKSLWGRQESLPLKMKKRKTSR